MLRNHVSASSRSPTWKYAMALSQSVCSCRERSSIESGKGDTGLRTESLAALGIATSAVGVAGATGSVGVSIGVNVCTAATGVGVSGVPAGTEGGAGDGGVKYTFCVESG